MVEYRWPEEVGETRAGLVGQRGDLEPVGTAGVGGERRERAARSYDADAPSGGQRLMGQQLHGVEELVQGVGADHSGAGEQRVHAGVRGLLAAFQRHDGLVSTELASDPGEAPRIAEALQMKHDHVGPWISLPVLQEIVRRDVGSVSGRDEGGQSHGAPGRVGEKRAGQGAGLGEHSDSAGRRIPDGEGGMQPGGRRGVDDAHRIRADQAHAAVAGDPDGVRKQDAALVPAVREAGRHDDGTANPLLRAGPQNVGHPLRGHRHDGQIDLGGHLAQIPVGIDRGDMGGRGVDGIHRSGEPAAEQPAEDLMTDRSGLAACPDHGDRSGVQQPVDAAGSVRMVQTAADPSPACPGTARDVVPRLHRIAHADLVAVRGREVETDRTQNLQNPPAARWHVRDQPAHPACPGGVDEQRAEPPPLMRVLDQDPEPRAIAAADLAVLDHPGDFAADEGTEHRGCPAVGRDDPLGDQRRIRRGAGQIRVMRIRLAKAQLEGAQPAGVRGAQRPHRDRASVGEHDILDRCRSLASGWENLCRPGLAGKLPWCVLPGLNAPVARRCRLGHARRDLASPGWTVRAGGGHSPHYMIFFAFYGSTGF